MNQKNQQPGSGPSEPDVGSVAQETAQLFAALGGWARQQGGGHAGTAAGAARAAEDAARHRLVHVGEVHQGDEGGVGVPAAQSPQAGPQGGAHALVPAVGDHHAASGEDCRYCPLCQAISLARSTSPEVKTHLLVAANALVQAAASALATQSPHDSSAPPVQKIDIEDPEDPASTDWDEVP